VHPATPLFAAPKVRDHLLRAALPDEAANVTAIPMNKCNADATAKSLKGDDRKTFMSACLKADKKS
jgi:psiF repeat